MGCLDMMYMYGYCLVEEAEGEEGEVTDEEELDCGSCVCVDGISADEAYCTAEKTYLEHYAGYDCDTIEYYLGVDCNDVETVAVAVNYMTVDACLDMLYVYGYC